MIKTLYLTLGIFGVWISHSLAEPFDRTFQGNGFELRVLTKEVEGKQRIEIQPTGFKANPHGVSFEAESPLSNVIFEDMSGDNIEEIVLIFTSVGSGSYGTAKAFSTNGGKSLTEIVIAEPDAKQLEGYMGHDEFQVMENTFVRRFPVYKPGDSNAAPSGGWRQFQYKLRAGEAAWQLKLDRVEEY